MRQEDFQKEVVRVRPKMVAQAHRYLHQLDEAEDIVQDALLKMCLIHQQLRPPIDTFASVLVRNLSLNYLRRRRKEDDFTDIDTILNELAEETEEPDTEQLMQIVESLPPRQQTIIRLHDMEGMGYREISLLTGMPETALRKSVSRIRLHIRLRYIAAISAAVALLIIGFVTYRAYQWDLFSRKYEGSYVIVCGQRNDNLREIRSQIKETLASANDIEVSANSRQIVNDAEKELLNSITDEAERSRLEKLLND